MAYIPDPTDVTQPTDAVIAETAQAEFRAMKSYIAGLVSGGAFGTNVFRKNKLINGDMRIDQRNSGAAVSTNNAFGPDRWKLNYAGVATGTLQQKTDTPPAGFLAYMRLATTSNTAVAVADSLGFMQSIEGSDCQDLLLGQAAAKSIAVSGWVRSTKAGIYPIALRNSANNRTYVGTINIVAINTWEYHSVVLTGDISGTWLLTTGIGLQLAIYPIAGGNFQTPPALWTAGAFVGTAAQQQNTANTDTFDSTGWQVEQAGAASPFEYIPEAFSLQLCKRYFELLGYGQFGAWGDATSYASMAFLFSVEKRAAPTVSLSTTTPSVSAVVDGPFSAVGAVVSILAGPTTRGGQFAVSGFPAGRTAKQPLIFTTDAVKVDAEL